MRRLAAHWTRVVWINPVPEEMWGWTHSIGMMRELVGRRMAPVTIDGLDRAVKMLWH